MFALTSKVHVYFQEMFSTVYQKNAKQNPVKTNVDFLMSASGFTLEKNSLKIFTFLIKQNTSMSLAL